MLSGHTDPVVFAGSISVFLSFFALRQAQDKPYVYPAYRKAYAANHSLSRLKVQKEASRLENGTGFLVLPEVIRLKP